MKQKHIIILIWAIICIVLALFIQPKSKRRSQQNYETFYTASITGKVDSVRIAYRGVGLRLFDGKEYYFFPRTDRLLNNGNIFVYTAEKGDSIIKPAYGDTIYLKKTSGEVLRYTFIHF